MDYEKLKNLFDEDDCFQIDNITSEPEKSPYTEIILIRDGSTEDSDYNLTVEKHTEYEDDYETIATFSSDLEGLQDAVECFKSHGGKQESIDVFL